MEIFVVFTDTKTALSKLIKMYTGQKYSHVSVSFNRELSEMYSFGRKDVNNAFIGGFVKENPAVPFFQQAECAIFRLPVTDVQYVKMREYVLSVEERKEQFRYNLSGLFGVMFNRKSGQENAFFCSQFVGEVLKSGGIKMADKPSHLILPGDIYRLPFLEYRYSGILADYPSLAVGHPDKGAEFCFPEIRGHISI